MFDRETVLTAPSPPPNITPGQLLAKRALERAWSCVRPRSGIGAETFIKPTSYRYRTQCGDFTMNKSLPARLTGAYRSLVARPYRVPPSRMVCPLSVESHPCFRPLDRVCRVHGSGGRPRADLADAANSRQHRLEQLLGNRELTGRIPFFDIVAGTCYTYPKRTKKGY